MEMRPEIAGCRCWYQNLGIQLWSKSLRRKGSIYPELVGRGMYLVLTYFRLWISDEVRLTELDIIQCHLFIFSLGLVSNRACLASHSWRSQNRIFLS